MVETATVVFDTSGVEGDERFVREYVLEAAERLREHRGCDGIDFAPLARKADLNGMDIEGGVLLRIVGNDIDGVIDAERDRWDALVDEGVAKSWERSESEQDLAAYMGEHGAELYARLGVLAGRMSRLVYEEFERTPDPVDEYPEEERDSPTGVGWWRLLHLLTIHQNYPYEDEIDAFAEGMRFALHTIARFDDPERAVSKTTEVIESFEAVREELDRIEGPDR